MLPSKISPSFHFLVLLFPAPSHLQFLFFPNFLVSPLALPRLLPVPVTSSLVFLSPRAGLLTWPPPYPCVPGPCPLPTVRGEDIIWNVSVQPQQRHHGQRHPGVGLCHGPHRGPLLLVSPKQPGGQGCLGGGRPWGQL